EFLLIQDNNRFDVKECSGNSDKKKYKNYRLIKKRNGIIGTGKSKGDGVFDFRYGPVTGGITECGMLHLYTYGERILSVEIDASYKHRSMEKRMTGKTPEEAIGTAEQICGNFALSHSLAFSASVENALGIETGETANRLRITALEMERIYNHLYVIGKLASAAAQKVLASHLSAMFEEALRINRILFNMRYIMDYNLIGGVRFIPGLNTINKVLDRTEKLSDSFSTIYTYSMESGNFLDRLHLTSVLKRETALEIGVTGPTLRASGEAEDLRSNNNLITGLQVQHKKEGDSLSRMEVRAGELLNSLDIVKNQLKYIKTYHAGKTRESGNILNTDSKTGKTDNSGSGTGASESPGGVIVYYTEIKNGKISYVFASTPSLFGFQAFSETLTGHIFTDFPFSLESFGVHFADLAR
ncbi:MAG: Ni,Fe-hydrogenase III large subunit, partial [Spirochaetes bacterium]|nr:Ni,Fe-hydrogenase III large subunit [Spirochaetota bacterium]